MTDVQVPAVAPVHLDTTALEAGLDEIRRAPSDNGTLELIVRRPVIDGREVLEEAELSTADGVVGDTWKVRGSGRTGDGRAHPDMQLNVINARLSRLVGGDDDDVRALAGDQLHVDLDLSVENLPPGTRLAAVRQRGRRQAAAPARPQRQGRHARHDPPRRHDHQAPLTASHDFPHKAPQRAVFSVLDRTEGIGCDSVAP
jgi:hypothetical protein